MNRLAHWIVQLAGWLLPANRQDWRRAMVAEFQTLAPLGALDFAIGCLRAAIVERITPLRKLLPAARGLVAAGSLVFGLVLLLIAAKGAAVIGDGDYPYYQVLVSNGDLDGAERHRTVFAPLMLAWMAALGLAFAAAAIALILRRTKLFGFCLAAGGVVVAAVAVPALMTEPRGSSLFVMVAVVPVVLVGVAGGLIGRAERRLA